MYTSPRSLRHRLLIEIDQTETRNPLPAPVPLSPRDQDDQINHVFPTEPRAVITPFLIKRSNDVRRSNPRQLCPSSIEVSRTCIIASRNTGETSSKAISRQYYCWHRHGREHCPTVPAWRRVEVKSTIPSEHDRKLRNFRGLLDTTPTAPVPSRSRLHTAECSEKE